MGSSIGCVRLVLALWVGAAAGCGNYNYNRAALVPHATPQLHSGMPLDGVAEISAGASSIRHLGDPGLGDPEAGVEIPGTQLFGDVRFGLGPVTLGLVYQNGLDAGAHPLKSTQPPVDGGSVQGYGTTLDFSVGTNNPRLRIGVGIEAMMWTVPYVEYFTCAAGETCFPYSIQAEGKDTVPTVGLSVTPSYRDDDITIFGGATVRQHPTLQQKGMDSDPLFVEPEVESGPFNVILSAGCEIALAKSLKVSGILYWDTTQNPAKYGPGAALMVSVPIGKRSTPASQLPPPPPGYGYPPPAPFPPMPPAPPAPPP